ncbi:hypothetical protein HC766_02445 [Candidatus Gracilibacteria bacterium]|nr:hypothetical protein [Candidatus Gracilibacteria bacterium]NJS41219.1 hypothetical protein [Candidatus Gracilibacteria bacterium]
MHRHSSDSWTLEKCDEVENLLKMYLKLAYLYPESGVVPTEEIDGMWHAWILDTTKYMSDCDQIFGYYLHHYPYLGLRGSDDEIALEKSFEQTRALFEEHFGVKLCEDYEASSCRDDCISLHLNPMFIEGNELNPVEFFNTQQRPRPIRK